jgi:hypothetical protein
VANICDNTAAAVASLPPDRLSIGAAVNNTFRQVGAVFGIAVLVSVLGTSAVQDELLAASDPDDHTVIELDLMASDGAERFEEFTDPVDGTRWRIDVGFTDSNWQCLWGNGCQGILDTAAPELAQGCCSEGAHLLGDDEAMTIEALGLMLDPARFENYADAAANGVLRDAPTNPNGGRATRVVNDACIFHNRPGFSGGEGCALYLGALDEDESPMDWRPNICWQVPIRVDDGEDGTRTLRRWNRSDWGDEGADLAWCCTERSHADGLPSAYTGEVPVALSMRRELQGIVGPEVAKALRDRTESGPDPWT